MPAQIEVRGVDGELKSVAEGTLSLKPNFAYTLKEVRVSSVQRDRCEQSAFLMSPMDPRTHEEVHAGCVRVHVA